MRAEGAPAMSPPFYAGPVTSSPSGEAKMGSNVFKSDPITIPFFSRFSKVLPALMSSHVEGTKRGGCPRSRVGSQIP